MFYDTSDDPALASMMSGDEIHSVWEQDEDIIDHVIFVIHGIGQQTEQFGYFEQHMETIRKTISEVLQARMPNSDIRIQLIPIEWHKYIHEQTDGCLDNISLQSIPGMRLISNDYMMDALYYLAKDRQQSIINHVARTFNDTYHEFIDTHPSFNGNIGIFGYSLGGIITWDILAHQRPIHSLEEQAQLDKMGLTVPRLDFKPQFLFGVGCPLGAFLNIRNQDPKLYHPDNSTTFENIYHPCDPLAYRMEPLYHADCRHHDSIHVEPGILTKTSIPLLTSLAGWASSWFNKSSSDTSQQSNSPSFTTTNIRSIPQSSPYNVNNTVSMDTPSFIATSNNNNDTYKLPQNTCSPPSIDSAVSDLGGPSPLNFNLDNDEISTGKNDEPSDRTTLLSSMGALFQYISPRNSFDRDSAIGSDIDEDDEDESDSKRMNFALDATPNNNHKVEEMSTSTSTSTNSNNSRFISNLRSPLSPSLPHGIAANPLNAPPAHMIYRRRQSQIYDSTTPQCWIQKKRCRSPLNVDADDCSYISSLEKDITLLNTLPGCRRLDYELQVGSIFGGMVSNQYLIGLQAHFSYWNNKDMLWRMVDQLEKALD